MVAGPLRALKLSRGLSAKEKAKNLSKFQRTSLRLGFAIDMNTITLTLEGMLCAFLKVKVKLRKLRVALNK